MSNEKLGKFILNNIKNSKNISSLIGNLMDHNIPEDLYANDGIGGDNMTCIIIQNK